VGFPILYTGNFILLTTIVDDHFDGEISKTEMSFRGTTMLASFIKGTGNENTGQRHTPTSFLHILVSLMIIYFQTSNVKFSAHSRRTNKPISSSR